MQEKVNVEDHLGLARKIAWSYKMSSRVPFDELVGEAYLALVVAEKAYDYKGDVKFSTYAHKAVTNRLNTYMNKINETRAVEIQMGVLESLESTTGAEKDRDEEPSAVKDTYTYFWHSYRVWGNVLQGIELDIYNLVCKEGYYTKRALEKKLRDMGYKFVEIWKAFRNMKLNLQSV